jgi:hypothetical protein
MKTRQLACLLAFSLSVGVVAGCKKDKDDDNEEELITTVTLGFQEVGTTTVRTFTFRDLDGPGGAAPSLFEPIVLAPGKTYDMAVLLLNETETPPEDITEEVEEEADDHQFYFVPSGVNVSISNLNTDADGLPLGTTSRWTTTTASVGTVKIVLKHKPGIKAAGDPITKGDTDIELDWTTRVQ